MKKYMIVAIISVFLLSLVLSAGVAMAEQLIEVDVTPNVLNIASESEWVTVHTNIPYSQVVKDSVKLTLNDINVAWTKVDNQGNLVAKFYSGDVKSALTAPSTAELTLIGMTIDGEIFMGTDTITVINCPSK